MNSDRPERADDKFVDDVLDAALRQYSRAEPPAGLEERVLRRLQERPHAPALAWLGRWQWAAGALATAAVVAIAFFVALNPARSPNPAPPAATAPPQQPSAPPRAVTPEQVAGLAIPPPSRRPRFNLVRPGAAHVGPDTAPPRLMAPTAAPAAPRLPVFPTSAPPSQQETQLAQLVAMLDPATLRALAAASQAPMRELKTEPLQIEALKIEPLPSSAEAKIPGREPNP